MGRNKKKSASHNNASQTSSAQQQQQQQRQQANKNGNNNNNTNNNNNNNNKNGNNKNGNDKNGISKQKPVVQASLSPSTSRPSTARVLLLFVELLVCAAGICICFGLWSLKQERVVTKPYHARTDNHSGGSGRAHSATSAGERLPTVFGLSLLQACAGFVIACTLLLLQAMWRMLQRCCCGGSARAAKPRVPSPPRFGLRDLWQVTSMGCTNVFGSTLGYAAMRQLSFPVVLAAKMSKMIPVTLVGICWYGTRYSPRKLLSCLLITAGVVSFYLLEEAAHPHTTATTTTTTTDAARAAGATQGTLQDTLRAWTSSAATARHGWVGFALLFANLLMDGFTNATQDELVRRRGWGGNALMAWTNAMSAMWVLGLLLLIEHGNVAQHVQATLLRVHTWASAVDALAPMLHKLQPWLQPMLLVLQQQQRLSSSAHAGATRAHALGKELGTLLSFLRRYPEAMYDVALMSGLHALGQFFIFRTIALFGSLTLTTITLLRKMGSVLLSIRVHHHVVNTPQWCALAAVACGVVCETWINVHDSARGRVGGVVVGASSSSSRSHKARAAARQMHSGAKNPAQMAAVLRQQQQQQQQQQQGNKKQQ